jgi:hypothetical protein
MHSFTTVQWASISSHPSTHRRGGSYSDRLFRALAIESPFLRKSDGIYEVGSQGADCGDNSGVGMADNLFGDNSYGPFVFPGLLETRN